MIRTRLWQRLAVTSMLLWWFASFDAGASQPLVLDLWPGVPPGETKELPAEADQTKAEDKLIAGSPIIKLGNVSKPQVAVFRPDPSIDTGAAVVICPGGGHHILAYDLEGTEVAQWLNTLGVTGVVLKYRVPFRDPDKRWSAAVQDAQRAMSLVRSHADSWKLDPERIGICGFSAGGEAAALTAIFLDGRQYEPIDSTDSVSSRPNFTMLIYPGGLQEKDELRLRDHVRVTQEVGPTFFVHAFDDRVSVQNTLLLASAMKEAGVPAELHIFESGGHGYGLRPTEFPITRWPELAAGWLARIGVVEGK